MQIISLFQCCQNNATVAMVIRCGGDGDDGDDGDGGGGGGGGGGG